MSSSSSTTTPSTASYDYNCQVTNNLTPPSASSALAPQTNWDGSVICINAYNTGAGTQQFFEQTLQQLPFSQGNSLAAGDTDTVTLNQTLNNQPVTLYNLIFAQPDNLFPVQSYGEGQSLNAKTNTFTYPNITLKTPAPPTGSGTNSNSPTVNAWIFCQNLWAYPNSTMATDFLSIGSTQYSNAKAATASADSIQKEMDNFFQGYPEFQNVTFDSYELVTSYLFAFVYAWANFAPTYTYYLYQASTASDSDTTAGGTTYVAAGMVVFTQQSGNPTVSTQGTSPGDWVTNANGNYQIYYYPVAGNTSNGQELYFSSQQLVSSTTDPVPSICLQLTYCSLSTITQLNADWGNIQPVMIGNVEASQVVLGVNLQPPAESLGTKIKDGLKSFFKSGALQDTMDVVGLMMGAKLMFEGIAWVIGKFKGGKKKEDEKEEEKEEENGETKEEAKDKEEQEEQNGETKEDVKNEGDDKAKEENQEKDDAPVNEGKNDLEEQNASSQQALQSVEDKLGPLAPEVVPPDQVVQAQNNIAANDQAAQNQRMQDKEADELEAQQQEVDNQAEGQVSKQEQSEENNIEEQEEAVDEIDPNSAGAQQQLASENADIKSSQQQVKKSGEEEGDELNNAQKSAVNESEAVDDSIQSDEVENQEDVADGDKSGGGSDEGDGVGKDLDDLA